MGHRASLGLSSHTRGSRGLIAVVVTVLLVGQPLAAAAAPGDPGLVEFSSGGFSAGEGDPSDTITVRRFGDDGGTVTVDYATVDGVAVAGSDYTAVSGTLTFAPGDHSESFPVGLIDDGDPEGDEAFSIVLSNPTGGAVISDQATTTVRIRDNEVVSGDLSVTELRSEPEDGIPDSLTVQRGGTGDGAVSVDYTVVDITATGGVDYTLVSGTVSWVDGETASKLITFTPIDDSLVEGDEIFQVVLSNPTGGATLDDRRIGTVFIYDDETDLPGEISFLSDTASAAEASGQIDFTVSRLAGSAGDASVDYAVTPVSADPGVDYIAVAGTLTWLDGDFSPRGVTVPLLDDPAVEGDETFTVTLTNFVGAGAGSNASAVGTIIDDEPAVDSEVLSIGGADHVAVLLVDRPTGATWVDVRDVATGSLVSSVPFGSSFVGSDLEIVPVVAGDPRLVVLGMRADGVVRATVREAVTGTLAGRADYGNAYSGDDLEVLGPNNLAVLGTHHVNQNVRVQRRSRSNVVLGTGFLGNAWSGDDLERSGANVVVLGTKFTNGNVRARTVDPTGVVVDTAYWGNAFTGTDVEAVGVDWAVLQEKLTTGAVRVQTRTSVGLKVGTASFGLTSYVPTDLEIVAGNVAVLSTSTVNQAVRVQTRDVDGVLVGTANYGTGYSGVDLEVVGSDVGVLGAKPNGKVRDQVRTAAGTVVATLTYN